MFNVKLTLDRIIIWRDAYFKGVLILKFFRKTTKKIMPYILNIFPAFPIFAWQFHTVKPALKYRFFMSLVQCNNEKLIYNIQHV